ncbi:MAG: protein kinase [Candidatus Aminicenantaceae bacterium]
MKCLNCQYENPEGMVFCIKCAAELPSSEKILETETGSIQEPVKELARGVTFAKRYEVIEELGKGGMGRVYRVVDKKVNEEVALKLIKPEIASDHKTIERFNNELKTARRISHKNVCRMYHLGEDEGTHYITMEYVSGESLKSMIRMTKQLSVATAVNIGMQVCEGLNEAHRLGVVHRDLKPQNIVIDREGNARIMDFGLARSLKTKGVTEAGVIIGTPAYMAPEQVEAEEVDQRSDIYSLGVVLFEMLTGRVPFEGETVLSIVMKHKSEIPPDPKRINRRIPEELSRLVLKCLEKDKESRYQSVGEVHDELARIEKAIPTPAEGIIKKELEREKLSGIKWKRNIFYGASALLLILLIAGGIFLSQRRNGAIDSIAVLPFENVNADPDTEYLSDGIAESIISRLTRLPNLKKVIARSSVFRYKGKEIDPQAVGQELGVDAVLVSQMNRHGDELILSVELMKVQDNSRIWGNRYRRKISEIFVVQEEITNSITENLRLSLTGEELERMTKRYTDNSEAFVAYSKGRFFWNKRTEEDLKRSIGYFEQAIQIDPNFALAYTGLSHSYLLLPEYGIFPPKEAYPIVKEAAQRALDIDPMLAEAHVSLAQIKRRYDYDWIAAERKYKRAIEIDPNYSTAHHWYAYDLMCIGRFDEAILEMRRAHELDPLSLVINRNLGQVYYRAGHYEEAIEALHKTLEMDPNFSFTHFHLGSTYLHMSMYEEALSEFRLEQEITQSLSQRVEAWIGVVYAKMGEKEKALNILKEIEKKSKDTYISQTSVAILHFALGDKDQGFEWLEKAYEEYDSWLRLLKTDPIFNGIRPDPRYITLLRKMGLEE